jgi:acyl carrier protein
VGRSGRRTTGGDLAAPVAATGSTHRVGRTAAWWEVVGLASVFERVRSIVAERLGVDEDKVTLDAEFIGDLNADSLDLVEVIMALEQEFDLEVKDEDAENIRTVGDAVTFIEEHGG